MFTKRIHAAGKFPNLPFPPPPFPMNFLMAVLWVIYELI